MHCTSYLFKHNDIYLTFSSSQLRLLYIFWKGFSRDLSASNFKKKGNCHVAGDLTRNLTGPSHFNFLNVVLLLQSIEGTFISVAKNQESSYSQPCFIIFFFDRFLSHKGFCVLSIMFVILLSIIFKYLHFFKPKYTMPNT